MPAPSVSALYPAAIGLDAITAHSTSLADHAAGADLGIAVPTCGDWTMADLLYHLYEVQRFWISMVAQRPDGPETYQSPERPDDPELVDTLRTCSASLVESLRGLDPAEAMWSWSREQTVGFTLRRQTHEALIHALDGALAVGADFGPVAAEQWADGVDEIMRVFVAVGPDDEFEPDGDGLVLRAADTGDEWVGRFGHAVVDGDQGKSRLPAMHVALGVDTDPAERRAVAEAGTEVVGTAADLDRWLWGRPTVGSVDFGSSADRADRLRSLLASVTA